MLHVDLAIAMLRLERDRMMRDAERRRRLRRPASSPPPPPEPLRPSRADDGVLERDAA